MVNIPGEIEVIPVEQLTPYARNSRTHSEEQVAQIAASIREFGFTNPVLINADGGIIAGHGRVMGAKAAGLKAVPCIRLAHLTPEQERAYVIADNQLALNAGWDNDLLALELRELNDAGFSLDLLGFDTDALDALLNGEQSDGGAEGLTDPDEAPETPADPVCRPGQLWVMGGHRLLCGDSTSEQHVSRLLAGGPADMIFTDPPYGMSYEGGRSKKGFGMIKGDDAQGGELIALVRRALAAAVANTKGGAAAYVCFPWRTYSEFEAALVDAKLQISACIVWDKKSIGLGHQHYRPQHEFIFYCKGDSFHGDRSESDVWYMSRGNTGAYVHPTQKPVELVERALANSSKRGDIVLDSFGGSGTTLIAAERHGRLARIMELDPRYCDVIIRRWQEFTGQQAILEATGETFAEVAAAHA